MWKYVKVREFLAEVGPSFRGKTTEMGTGLLCSLYIIRVAYYSNGLLCSLYLIRIS